MAVPSSQIAAVWVKEELDEVDWAPLKEVCLKVVTKKWRSKSVEEISDYVEEYLQYIAEDLRNDFASCATDGVVPHFEIDNEQSPYIRTIKSFDSNVLKKLTAIDPLEVESLCRDILEKLGASPWNTDKTNDGGVDFIGLELQFIRADLTIPHGCKFAVIGQTKRYKQGNVITETQLREFVGAAVLKKHELQLRGKIGPLTPVIYAFWTTSDFDPSAKIFARAVGLWFMGGRTLAKYVDSLGLKDKLMALP